MIEMLGLPLLVCLALSAIMGYLGIHVLKREIIFIDIALAQLAAVGAVVAELAFPARDAAHSHGGSPAAFLFAYAFVLLAAGFYAFVRRRVTQIPVEAVIGVTYAAAAAGALFLPGLSPRFHGHVEHMLAGSMLFVEWRDLVVCAVGFAAVGALFRLFRGPLTAISEDYGRAAREGVNVVLWDFVFYALCGLVITLAVRVSGVVVVFAFLIIPATISALFASSWRSRLLAAWAAGATASVLGLLFAYRLDFSPGPSVAMFLGVELVLAGLASLWRSRILTVAAAGSLGVVLVALLLIGPASEGRDVQATEEHSMRHVPHHEELAHVHGTEEAAADFASRVERARDAHGLVRLFSQAPDEGARSDVVARALDVDLRTGVRLTLEFLSRDPPLFFRQAAVDKLEEATGKPSDFVPDEPWSSDVNRAAVSGLTTEFGVDIPRLPPGPLDRRGPPAR